MSNSSTLTPPGYAGSTVDESHDVDGLTGTFSAQFNGFGGLAAALEPLSIGAVITTRGNLRSTRGFTYQWADETDTIAQAGNRIVLPTAFGIGGAYRAGDRIIVAADYYAQQWSTSAIDGSAPAGIRNWQRFGFGLERSASRERGAHGFDRVALRLGFLYDATYYEVNDQPINAWSVTGGLGLPLSSEVRMDLAVEYGSRGTTGTGLVQDKFIRVFLSLNLSELWFIQFPEE